MESDGDDARKEQTSIFLSVKLLKPHDRGPSSHGALLGGRFGHDDDGSPVCENTNVPPCSVARRLAGCGRAREHLQ